MYVYFEYINIYNRAYLDSNTTQTYSHYRIFYKFNVIYGMSVLKNIYVLLIFSNISAKSKVFSASIQPKMKSFSKAKTNTNANMQSYWTEMTKTTKKLLIKNRENNREIKYDESIYALHDQLRNIIGNMKNVSEIQLLLEFYGLDKIIAVTYDDYFIYLSYKDTTFEIKTIQSSLKDMSPLFLQSILRIYDKMTDVYIHSIYTGQKYLQMHKNADRSIYRRWFYSWEVSVSMKMTREGAEIYYHAVRQWTFVAKFSLAFAVVLSFCLLSIRIANTYYVTRKPSGK